MNERETEDKTYAEASMRAVGRNIADLWRGLVDGDMPRKEALAVICAYVQAMALRRSDDETEE